MPSDRPIPTVGIHYGVPFAEYCAWDALNHSALKASAKSMAHTRHELDDIENHDTPEKRKGTAFHAWVLERDRWSELVAVRPEFKGEGSKAAREAWEAQHAGKTIIPEDAAAEVFAMSRSLSANANARRLALTPGEVETAVVWIEETTGLLCKARCDKFIAEPCIAADIKTTQDASWAGFGRSVATFSYHTQIDFYRRGFAANGLNPEWYILAVESDAPHACAVYTLDAHAKWAGRVLVDRWLKAVAECVRTKNWPGYPEGVTALSLPAWACKGLSEEENSL